MGFFVVSEIVESALDLAGDRWNSNVEPSGRALEHDDERE